MTFPTDASACFSATAAVLLANKSGRLVPIATNVIAVTSFSRPTKHPKIVAKSPMTAVRMPIIPRAIQKANQPPNHVQGGHMANITWNHKKSTSDEKLAHGLSAK